MRAKDANAMRNSKPRPNIPVSPSMGKKGKKGKENKSECGMVRVAMEFVVEEGRQNTYDTPVSPNAENQKGE